MVSGGAANRDTATSGTRRAMGRDAQYESAGIDAEFAAILLILNKQGCRGDAGRDAGRPQCSTAPILLATTPATPLEVKIGVWVIPQQGQMLRQRAAEG